MKKIFKVYIFCLFISCNNIDFYKDLENCINLNYNENLPYSSEKVNIIDSIGKYEAYLIQLNLLSDRTEKSYNYLIDNDLESNELNKILTLTKTKMSFFYEYNSSTMKKILIYNACPSRINETSKKIYDIKIIYEKIFTEGAPNKNILKELSLKTNYNNKISRLLLCNLIYLNWKEEHLRGLPGYIDRKEDSDIFK